MSINHGCLVPTRRRETSTGLYIRSLWHLGISDTKTLRYYASFSYVTRSVNDAEVLSTVSATSVRKLKSFQNLHLLFLFFKKTRYLFWKYSILHAMEVYRCFVVSTSVLSSFCLFNTSSVQYKMVWTAVAIGMKRLTEWSRLIALSLVMII